MTREEYANFLLPECKHDRKYYEEKYPKRNLGENVIVTRLAPSPTGMVHIGSLYQGMVASKLAHQTNGVCFLRIEDTDQKRSIDDGINVIINSLKSYDINFDEGPILDNNMDKGNYGPYIQSMRKDIYQAFVKDLIIKDLAYPSFLTPEEKEKMLSIEKARKERLGYYGKWTSKERALSIDEVVEKIKNGEKYTIRLKSNGDFDRKIVINDSIKGKIELPENDMDIVLLKEDGIPTYHFAHAVDDTLMGTTHVTRGDEWISSLNIHYELFKVLGFKLPTYAHLATIQKEENGIRRKISKRKDPEANVLYYKEKGIPVEAVKIYLYTLANSNFEEWMNNNPDKDIEEFNMTFDKMSTSGSLFDMDKLLNISRNYLSKLTAIEVYDNLLSWSSIYDKEFNKLITKYKDKTIDTLNIERESNKPRKDFAMYSEIKDSIYFMYNELYEAKDYEWQKITNINEIKNILNIYIDKYYDESLNEEEWFNNVKLLCDNLGYASNMKEYKKEPDKFKGNVADISTVIRVAITTKSRTPNLYDIIKILGKDEIKRRIDMI